MADYKSAYTGAQIDEGIAKALTALQELPTHTHTAAAVGAAPAGYGLGGANRVTWEEIDNVVAPGWYDIAGAYRIGGFTANYWYMHVASYGSGSAHAMQHIYPVDAGRCELVRRKHTNNWGEWEWINPPMQLGKEYRTTERYIGKAVYVTAISLGTLPASGEKGTTYTASTSPATAVVHLAAYAKSASGTINQFPFCDSSGVLQGKASATSSKVYIDAFEDMSGNTGYAIIKYTKD